VIRKEVTAYQHIFISYNFILHNAPDSIIELTRDY
jgi:hypothetical protein